MKMTERGIVVFGEKNTHTKLKQGFETNPTFKKL